MKIEVDSKTACDLQRMSQLSCRKEEEEEQYQFLAEEMCEESNANCNQTTGTLTMIDQDLNCLPFPVTASEISKNQQNDQNLSGLMVKKKRAATERIARIALADLAKYFDLPIVEASRNLKVGLTVLKRKCREFGIPRWPHRKIKSLDTLIRDLQEAEREQTENKAAAIAVAKRKRLLENEKRSIERKPCMEIQSETKRFRQDVFKRRHRARAFKNQTQSISPN